MLQPIAESNLFWIFYRYVKQQDNEFIGDQMSLRQINLSTALTHLRENAPISRAGLAESMGLNRATITRLVRELIKHGFVREAGLQSLCAGCPSILLQLNPDAGCIIGAAIEVDLGSSILTDLSAHVLWRQEMRLGDINEQAAVLDGIVQLIRKARSKSTETNCHLLGLGMSFLGLVDASSGVLLFVPDMRWSNLPIKPWVEKEFKIPVNVNNKTNMAALAESYYGAARHSDNVFYIKITDRVSAGKRLS